MKIDIFNPNKKYNIIYADPPWHYDFGKSSSRFVGDKYNLMKISELADLPIKSLADKDCVLLMWATFPRIDYALQLIKSWGFKYKTCAFCWVKKNKKQNTNFWGMGYYTRSNAEICLLAIKGKPLDRKSHNVHQIIETPIEQHSKKPDIARDKIVELFGDLPRIELFARQYADGWDCWGNEAPDEQQVG